MNQLKRIINPKGLLIFLCLAAILLTAGAQKVSATEQKPYLIKVNRACNTITIYQRDEYGEYTVPVKAMACSVGVGSRTITGTFQTKERYRWKALMGDVWGQYATRIVGGILFHSVYYYKNGNPASLATKEFNKLGAAASHGCIRLTVEDAKWIYDNCPTDTTVIIYDNKKNPGPLGKPETIKIASSVRWDPTDPNTDNPYRVNLPKISGAKDITIEWGEEVDLLKGISAVSSVEVDITSKLEILGKVDYGKPGKYIITYSVTDELNRASIETITVTVNENLADPEIIGVKDLLVTDKDIIDETFALKGIEVVRGKAKLDQDQVKVTIEQNDEDDFSITYQVTIGKKTITKKAAVHIDNEAPVITGIKDMTIEAGEIPSKGYVLEGIAVSDNYTTVQNINFVTTIVESSDGTYLVNYVATDEAGNITSAKANIYN